MTKQSTFPLHDRAVGGGLKDRLQADRDAGKTYLDIAYELRDDGIDVDPSTIHRWCRELGIEAS